MNNLQNSLKGLGQSPPKDRVEEENKESRNSPSKKEPTYNILITNNSFKFCNKPEGEDQAVD